MNTPRTFGPSTSLITTLSLVLCAAPASAQTGMMSKEPVERRARHTVRNFPTLDPSAGFESLVLYRAKRASSLFWTLRHLECLDRLGVETSALRRELHEHAGDGEEALLNHRIMGMPADEIVRWHAEVARRAEQIRLRPPRLPKYLAKRGAREDYEYQLIALGAWEANKRELESILARLAVRHAKRVRAERPVLQAPPRQPSVFEAQREGYSRALRDERQAFSKLGMIERLQYPSGKNPPPLPEETALADEVVEPSANEEDDEKDIWELLFLTHTVEPGETLESIARRYGMTVPIIALCNEKRPGEQGELATPGNELIVPRESEASTVAVRNADGSLSHWLGSDESTRDIAMLYDLSLSDLRRANPTLKKSGWKPGVLVKLPPSASQAKVDLLLDGDQVHKLWEERKAGRQVDHAAVMSSTTFRDRPLGE